MDEGLTDRHLDTHRNRTDEEEGKSDRETRRPANTDRREGECGSGPEKDRRPPAAESGDELNEAVPNDHRDGQERRDHPGDPYGVAARSSRKYGCQAYQAHMKNAALDGSGDHDQTEGPIAPPEPDAGRRNSVRFRRKCAPRDRLRLETDVVHPEEREDEEKQQEQRSHDERNREVDLTKQPSADCADQHRRAADHLPVGEDTIHRTFVAQTANAVDEPRFHRPRIERVPETKEHGNDREGDHSPADLGECHIGKGRRREHKHGQQEGGAPPHCVGDNAGRDLEQHRPDREGGVGEEDLGDREAGVEEKQRVDTPDDRSSERVDPGVGVVPVNECTRGSRHG